MAGEETHPFPIVDMGTDLVLLVEAGGRVGLNVQIRGDEPVTGTNAIAIVVVDVEFNGPHVRELGNTVSARDRRNWRAERTVTNDIRSSLEYCASTVWHSHNSEMLGNSMILSKGVCGS